MKLTIVEIDLWFLVAQMQLDKTRWLFFKIWQIDTARFYSYLLDMALIGLWGADKIHKMVFIRRFLVGHFIYFGELF